MMPLAMSFFRKNFFIPDDTSIHENDRIVDSDGNLIIVGFTSISENVGFVTKIDSNGNQLGH